MTAINLILIGAPRSGTNMLRDILSSVENIGTWPCDEINYIWRHGNVRYPSDALPAELASERVARYIRGKFDALRRSRQLDVVLEKTCANCLRVPFVNRVFPEAKFIHIYRDGLDVISSARTRWKANFELLYTLKKTRYVPFNDIPYYGARFLRNRAYRLFSKNRRLAFWGPVLPDMARILNQFDLEEVCALQWKYCVESAEVAFAEMDDSRVIRVNYDDFVMDPVTELTRLLHFVGIHLSNNRLRQAVAGVSSNSVGKGRTTLSPKQIESLEKLVGNTLSRYGKH